MVALLLFLQVALLLGTAAWTFHALGDIDLAWTDDDQLIELIGRLSHTFIFIALAFLTLLFALSFFALWRNAWSVSMLAQTFILLEMLFLFSMTAPLYVYLNMGYAVFLVLYLNHPDVIATFHVRETPLETAGESV
jgi:hypothetical protein